MFGYDSSIYDFPLVTVDLETTGAYPVGDEICEIAIIRYENSKVVEEFQSLVKPKKPMTKENIKIHGITNEMVENSPPIEDVIQHVYSLIKDGIFIAHHAPFDLGFMAHEFEKAKLDLPVMPALCTSLLSRALFKDVENHRLQTLIAYFEFEQGTAHRALDDAIACFGVAKKCIEQLNEPSLKMMLAAQVKNLSWDNFSINQIRRRETHSYLVEAIEEGLDMCFDYIKGSGVDAGRKMKPRGVVRNPDSDFLFGKCLRDNKDKRFYLNKINSVYPVKK